MTTILPPSDRFARAADAHGIPDYMVEGLWNYSQYHVQPGDFLMAVLEGDLFGALRRADDINFNRLGNYGRFLFNNVPASCFGTPGRVALWLTRKETDNAAVSE